MKNTFDQIDAVHLMNRANYRSVGEAIRAQRKLMREWAVSNRPDFGRNSVREYCHLYFFTQSA